MKRRLQLTHLAHVFLLSSLFAIPLHIASQDVMVGSIAGELSATPTGGATYTIPIDCPQGVGLQPTLSLTYNSQGGNGIAGWGWNLSGLSAIIRTPKTRYYDGRNEGITWTKEDPLSLNGQRLFVTQTLDNGNTVEYRLENDPGVMIRGYEYNMQSWGPSYFKVHTKDGLIMTYGRTNDQTSYTLLYEIARTQTNSVIVGWNLIEIEDCNSNFVKIDYVNTYNGYTGNMVRKITYGGNKREGTTGTITLLFNYEKRTDDIQGFLAGKENLLQLRLKSIQSSVDGNTQKEYRLSYQSDSKISRLSAIDLYNEGSKVVNPLTFTYGETPSQPSDVDISYIRQKSGNSEKEYVGLVSFDLDGDGISEIGNLYSEKGENPGEYNTTFINAYIHQKDQNFVSTECFPVRAFRAGVHFYTLSESRNLFGDFNGNGTADRVFINTSSFQLGNSLPRVSVKINDCMNNSYPLLFNKEVGSSSETPFFAIGNCKGDPFSTLLFISNTPERLSNGHFKYYYNIVSGGIDTTSLFVPQNSYITLPSKIKEVSLINLGNASYHDDLWISMENGHNRIFVNNQNNGSTFFSEIPIDPGTATSGNAICRFADMNGDGLTDIIMRKHDDTWKIAYNKGNHSFDVQGIYDMSGNNLLLPRKSLVDTGNPIILYEEKDDIFLLDINQDGLIDIISADELITPDIHNQGFPDEYALFDFERTFWTIYLNTGTGFSKWKEYTSNRKSSYSCFGDFLGKGTVNWVHSIDNHSKVVITDFGFKTGQNLLTVINNPVCSPTTLSYKPHTESKVTGYTDSYTLKEYLQLGYKPFKASLFKVFAESNDGLNQYSYKYSDPLLNWSYRGFIGSRFIEKKDIKKNLWEVTEQIFPDAGKAYFLMLPFRKSIYGKKGDLTTLISSEDYTYSIKTYGTTKRYTVRPASQTQKNTLAGGRTVKNFFISYDDYNNLLESRTEGLGQTEINKFSYQGRGSWCPNKPNYVEKKVTCEADNSTILRISRHKYDIRGNLSETKADSGYVNMMTTRYQNYDKYGHPQLIIEEANGATRTSTCTYTNSGRFINSKTNHLGQTTTYVWDETKGSLNRSTNRLGTTSYAYDRFGQITSITYPTGMIETQSLQWVKNDPKIKYRTVQTRPDTPGKTVWTYYDQYGREVAKDTYSADNSNKIARISTEYYSNGRLYRVSQPTFTNAAVQWATTYNYDTYGRTSSTTSPEGTTTVTYNTTEDNMTVKTPDNMTKTTVWNAAGQVAKVLTNDKAVEYTYTAGNNVKTAKSGTGNFIVQKEYDLQGNLTKETDPDLGTKEYSYDGWGQLKTEKTTKQGQMYSSVTYNYNALGLLTSKVRGGETTTYTYDTYKRIQSISLSNGNHYRSFEYGSFDRIISTTDFVYGKRLTTGKGYDSYGRVRTETYPTGYYTVNTYDSCGFLRKITDNASRLIWQLDSCDAAGRVLKETKGSTTTRYTYDAAGRILTILSPGFINSVYTYYPTGNVKTFTDLISNQTETYKYDNMDRLLDWRSHSASYLYENCMEYSESANRIFIKNDYAWAKNISHTYSYPAVATTASNTMMSTVTSAIGTSYATPPSHSINYTGFNKVKYLSQGTYGESITFEYGVDEQRIYAREDHRYGMERYYLGNYEEEYGIYGSDEAKIHYIYGGNGLAAVYKGTATTGTLYSAYTDRQGSLVALARGTTLAQRYAYDPWGNRRSPSNWRTKDESGSGGLIVRRGYTLHEHLPEFGLINMNGRMYDPLTCTFMSPDPYIQDPTNWLNYNRYAYCMNNPLKYTDPDGEFWMFVIGGALIGAYVGSSVKGGSFNPAKWEGNWWQGAIYGGIIGAATGAVVGAAWEAGATINFAISAYSSKPITLLSFSQASASLGGGVTMSVGGGLGLGSGLSYTFGRKKENKDITPVDVGVEWLTGTGPRDREFGEGDYFTELLKEHDHIEKTREMIRNQGSAGNLEPGFSGNNPYRLDGYEGIGLYIKDYSTLVTGGLTGNLAVTYLGSYALEYKVLSYDKNCAIVQFEVNNTSTATSAMRPPVIGYGEFWKDNISPRINSIFSEGPMSKTTQRFVWKETIRWK